VLEPTITHLHTSPHMLVYNFSGAGVQSLAWLHGVAGSSRTVLEAVDRYSRLSFTEALGSEPDKFVSAEAAEALAKHALARAAQLLETPKPIIGLSCTAAIISDKPKRGDHHAYVSLADHVGMSTYYLKLTKGARNRAAEELLVSQLVIWAIAQSYGLTAFALPLGDDELRLTETPAEGFNDLLAAKLNILGCDSLGKLESHQELVGKVLLSGSFNPVHEGHLELAKTVAQHVGQEVMFEIPLINAAKAPLSLPEAMRRTRQFIGKAPVVLSKAPLFHQKALLFPQSRFIVGADTALRLIQQRFYEDDVDKMMRSFEVIRAQGCSFMVAGRLVTQGSQQSFITLNDIDIPAELRDLFEKLDEKDFRKDISSTKVRQTRAQAIQRLADEAS